jgi:hypothetical protein
MAGRAIGAYLRESGVSRTLLETACPVAFARSDSADSGADATSAPKPDRTGARFADEPALIAESQLHGIVHHTGGP